MTASKKVLRVSLSIDNQPHRVRMATLPLAIAYRNNTIEFWYEEYPHLENKDRFFAVYGTGEEIPADAVYRGTAQRNGLGEVWHLYEVFP